MDDTGNNKERTKEDGAKTDWTAKSLAVVSALVAISGAAVSAWNMKETANINRESVRTSKENLQREVRRPYVERMIALYAETAKQTSRIATRSQGVLSEQDTARFWELYSGELRLVASPQVKQRMEEFAEKLVSLPPPADRTIAISRSKGLGQASQSLCDAMAADIQQATDMQEDSETVPRTSR